MKNNALIFISAVLSLFVSFASFAEDARSVTISAVNKVDGLAKSLEISLGETTVTNTLFVAYGVTDAGDDINAWTKVDTVCVVTPETNSVTYTLPDGWGDTITAIRFFLAKGVILPYDYRVEYLVTTGSQKLTVTKRTFKYLETKFTQVGAITKRVFLAGVHANCWYDIKTTGKTSGGYTVPIGTPFVFAITNINNDAKVYIDGKSAGGIGGGDVAYRYNLLNGVINFNIGGAGTMEAFIGHVFDVNIYNDGKQIANFITCVKDGTTYYYDTLNKAFSGMSGCGTGPVVGYVTDQEERSIVSVSEAYMSEIMMTIVSDMDEPVGMEPMPGFYDGNGVYSSPSVSEVDNIRYTCNGYTLEKLTDAGWQSVGTASEYSYTYPNDGIARRLTWNWELTHYKVDFSSSPSANGTTILEPYIEDCYYPAGSTLTFTPVPNDGAYHTGYYVVSDKEVTSGSEYTLTVAHPEGQQSITIECPKTVTSYYAGNWGMNGSQLTNGVWTFNTSSYGDGLKLSSRVSGYGMLDLRNVERDTGKKVLAADTISHQIHYRSPTSVYAPDLYVLNGRVFHSSYSLRHIEVSTNLTSLGDCVFYNNFNLTNISPKVFGKLTYIGDQSLDKCTKLTGDFKFPACKTLATKYSFSGTKITSIELPACDSICQQAFNSCTRLTNVLTYATSYGEKPFNGASALKTISFTNPKGLSSIPSSMFSGVNALTDVWYHGTNAPASIGASAFNVSAPYPHIHIMNNKDIEGWRALATRLPDPTGTTLSALTDDDKARVDYPGIVRTVGFINANGNNAWIVKWPINISTLFMVQ